LVNRSERGVVTGFRGKTITSPEWKKRGRMEGIALPVGALKTQKECPEG